ncbi:MAG TPA: hypothetical protein VKW76_05580 [Candidatus Binatia bacterium]|nr:hypothetical protein [Candidatus Binatia bacterium]
MRFGFLVPVCAGLALAGIAVGVRAASMQTPLDAVTAAVSKLGPMYPNVPAKHLCACEDAGLQGTVGYLNWLPHGYGGGNETIQVVCAYQGYNIATGDVAATGNCVSFVLLK